MSDVKGKVVWVTGASAGIGEALAIVLAGRGVIGPPLRQASGGAAKTSRIDRKFNCAARPH